MRKSATYSVGIIGGASAGAEVAAQLAAGGFRVAVFEQNARPFGKIEDGLPRWHAAQREKEYKAIAAKLSHENIHLVPLTKVGRDLSFNDLLTQWNFSAVILACGAWRDRPLPVEHEERYRSKGLLYQNPLIHWFNHYGEEGYRGPHFELDDGAIVVGGGLASIDVAKILMLETVRRRLEERGIESSLLDMERQGIPKFLRAHGLCFEELELSGCTLVYRRRLEDMPIMPMPDPATPERRQKIERVRLRMLEKAQAKFLFRVEPLAQPETIVGEAGKLAALVLRRNRVDEGKLTSTSECFEIRTPLVVSSIGSIPEPIPGIAMKGDLYDFVDEDEGQLSDLPFVFGAGNVVTGKGNIIASRRHAAQIAENMIESYLGISEDEHAAEEEIPERVADAVHKSAEEIATQVRQRQTPLSKEQLDQFERRVEERQRRVGYSGQLADWLAATHVVPEP